MSCLAKLQTRAARHLIGVFVVALSALGSTTILMAQPKPGYAPSSTHIFPAGGRRGTTVAVRVGGECIPPGTRFVLSQGETAVTSILEQRILDQGDPSPRRRPTEIPITYPKEWKSQIALSKTQRLGPIYWRLVCANGGTGSRPFIVGDGPEFIERESNSHLELAERVSLPVAINGQICGERDTDHFRFSAKAGDVIACEVLARRLGSPLDPIVEITNGRGIQLPMSQVFQGDDPIIAAKIKDDGDYILRISHVSFHGDPSYVYRVHLSKKPYVFAAFPSGGQSRTKRFFTLYALSGETIPASLSQSFSIPTGPPFQIESSWFANRVRLDVNEFENILDIKNNNNRSTSMAVKPPITIDGQLDKHHTDWFRFFATKNQAISIACRTRPFQSSAMPAICLFDKNEKLIKEAWSADSKDGECRMDWTPEQTGEYFLRVQDIRSKTGVDSIYRLSIGPANPDFQLYVANDCLNVVQGGKAQLKIHIRRFGGFNGSVRLEFEGTPKGITIGNADIPAGNSDATVPISADETARAEFSCLKIIGHARIGDDEVARVARAHHLGHDSEGNSIGESTVNEICLHVLHKPVFRLYCYEAYQYAHRGSVFLYPMYVERMNGFEGEITLQIGDRQNRDLDGIQMFEVTIPSDKNQIELPIYLPETMHINIQSQSQLYAQGYARFLDQHKLQQAVTVLSEKRNMLRTLPPLVKLKALEPEIKAPHQSDLPFRFTIERTKNFSGPMEFHLIEPKRLAKKIPPVSIGADESLVEMVVTADQWSFVHRQSRFRFRATGNMDSTKLITEAEVLVRYPQPVDGF